MYKGQRLGKIIVATIFLCLTSVGRTVAGSVELVDPGSIASNQIEDFSSFTEGNYDEIVDIQGASLAERFAGQTLGFNGEFDLVTGTPDDPLVLVAGAPEQNLAVSSVSGSLALGGQGPNSLLGEGAIAILFEDDQLEIGLQIVGSNGGPAIFDFFHRNGSLIDSVSIPTTADGPLAFRQSSGIADIAGVVLTNTDTGGIGIDDLRYTVSLACADAATIDCVFFDDFNDGSVDGGVFTAIDSTLSEVDGKLLVTVSGETGGVAIANPLPQFPALSSDDPNQAWFYRIDIDSPFKKPGSGSLEIASLGPQGEVIDLSTYDNVQGRILTTERDPFGNIIISDDGPFAADAPQRKEKKRDYKLFPPSCTGPRCDYGLGPLPDGGVVIVARWKIGKLSAAFEGPVIAPTLAGLRITSTESFAVREIEMKTAEAFPDDIETIWSVSPEELGISGGETVSIHGEGLESLGVIEVEVGGVPAQDVEIVNDETVTFTTPPGTVGPTEVVLKNLDGSLEISFESTRYFSGAEPLHLQTLSRATASVGNPYSGSIGATGGTGPYTFALASGDLPEGLTLTGDGTVSGIPLDTGLFAFFVSVEDTLSNSDVRLLFLEVSDETTVFLDGFESGDTSAWSNTVP